MFLVSPIAVTVATNMSSTEEQTGAVCASRTDKCRLLLGWLAGVVIVVVVLGAVILVGLFTSQANRILILAVLSVSSAAVILLCYFKPLEPCKRQETEEIEPSDDPPSYAEVIKSEMPPPAYFTVVREDLYMPTPAPATMGAGFYLPETPRTKHTTSTSRTPRNTPSLSRWFVGPSCGPSLVRSSADSSLIGSFGSPVIIRPSSRRIVISSFDSPAVIRSGGNCVAVRSHTGPSDVRPCAGASLSKSRSSPAIDNLVSRPALTRQSDRPSLTKSPSSPALGRLLTRSSSSSIDSSPVVNGSCDSPIISRTSGSPSVSSPVSSGSTGSSPDNPSSDSSSVINQESRVLCQEGLQEATGMGAERQQGRRRQHLGVILSVAALQGTPEPSASNTSPTFPSRNSRLLWYSMYY